VRRWIDALPREVRRAVELVDREVDSPWVRDYGEYRPYLDRLRLRDAFSMPVYQRRPTAKRARAVLEAAMPGVEILRIPAWEMADLGGAVHCVALGLFVP
jgi:agmatine/peptidylarginine deiminase